MHWMRHTPTEQEPWWAWQIIENGRVTFTIFD